ncbi:uncharacterized protein FA14DRAFT_95108 [Meira miltonrushii]|uniref:Glycosyl transferase CAP10 domain-containing protein n=1 Tax=Meira miltonrushii TaxID=1280837 RepID=A0A316V584_9BASI|nr:uncharacterized protein FA14DRAFT_95108 [Meira miltonrushii]PWN31383.1 hypothetical protein FA14DRAFT_95108 [Meira miltonrushii]
MIRFQKEEKEDESTLLPTSLYSVKHRPGIRKREKGISRLITFIFILLIFLFFFHYREENEIKCAPAWSSISALHCHHKAGQEKFNRLLQDQSRSVDQAIRRYKQKYNREPPQGFSHWVEYALANDSPIIDDFDQLEADLKPLRSVPPDILKARIYSGMNQGYVKLAEIKNGKVTMGNDELGPIPKRARAATALIEPIAQFLPDMEWLMNWGDRQVVRGQASPKDHENEQVVLSPFSPEIATSVLTSQCTKNTLANTSISEDRPSLDICKNTTNSALAREHGVFHSKADGFKASLPVISVGKFSTFEDILAPWCYGENGYIMHKDDKLPSFQSKEPALYWRGGTNGLTPTNVENWQYNHRARILIRLAQMQEMLADRLGSKNLRSVQSQLKDIGYNLPSLTKKQTEELSRLSPKNFNVGRARGNLFPDRELQEHPAETSVIESVLGRLEENDRTVAFNYRFLLDMDGLGVSCRFYRLMGSGGVVFKQTQWAEWHDDRLVPYVHYIPIDLDASQVPAFMDMMINTDVGRDIANTIGDEAKRWTSTGLRKVDLTVLYYRLLLELAQIYRG